MNRGHFFEAPSGRWTAGLFVKNGQAIGMRTLANECVPQGVRRSIN
jgi:hypothetical protein